MGSDGSPVNAAPRLFYFNPRSPDGERRVAADMVQAECQFQSTLPGWGATPMISTRVLPRTNFNPRSPDGERRSDHCRCHYRPEISIHAPRMGSDYAPLICFNVCSIFQSTLPGWGATFQTTVKIPLLHYFNPRSQDGERPSMALVVRPRFLFQSTLPGWGATSCAPTSRRARPAFQSTLPGWGATVPVGPGMPLVDISIHAPRMGSDGGHDVVGPAFDISIHAPRMGSDTATLTCCSMAGCDFNPRSPDGERLRAIISQSSISDISIHAPRMGSD